MSRSGKSNAGGRLTSEGSRSTSEPYLLIAVTIAISTVVLVLPSTGTGTKTVTSLSNGASNDPPLENRHHPGLYWMAALCTAFSIRWLLGILMVTHSWVTGVMMNYISVRVCGKFAIGLHWLGRMVVRVEQGLLLCCCLLKLSTERYLINVMHSQILTPLLLLPLPPLPPAPLISLSLISSLSHHCQITITSLLHRYSHPYHITITSLSHRYCHPYPIPITDTSTTTSLTGPWVLLLSAVYVTGSASLLMGIGMLVTSVRNLQGLDKDTEETRDASVTVKRQGQEKVEVEVAVEGTVDSKVRMQDANRDKSSPQQEPSPNYIDSLQMCTEVALDHTFALMLCLPTAAYALQVLFEWRQVKSLIIGITAITMTISITIITTTIIIIITNITATITTKRHHHHHHHYHHYHYHYHYHYYQHIIIIIIIIIITTITIAPIITQFVHPASLPLFVPSHSGLVYSSLSLLAAVEGVRFIVVLHHTREIFERYNCTCINAI